VDKKSGADEGVPRAPDFAFLGKTVQKALPPSLFAKLSRFPVLHADIHAAHQFRRLPLRR